MRTAWRRRTGNSSRTVGLIALLLPAVLILGTKAISGGAWFQQRISAYYYTSTRNVFVGALCAIGVFFLVYQHRPIEHGFEVDKWVANVAAVAAIGVAFFPTARSAAASGSVSDGARHLGRRALHVPRGTLSACSCSRVTVTRHRSPSRR